MTFIGPENSSKIFQQKAKTNHQGDYRITNKQNITDMLGSNNVRV